MPEPQYGEPWKWDASIESMQTAEKDTLLSIGLHDDCIFMSNDKLARIVACVNFCRYLSDKQLAGWTIRVPCAELPATYLLEEA